MTLDQFLDAYYEDLNGEILKCYRVEEGSSVAVLECDDWTDTPSSDSRRMFELSFQGIVDSTLVAPYSWIEEVYSTKGMLIEDHYASSWTDLYWKVAPANPHEVLGRLYVNHERLADRQRDLREYLVATPKTLCFPSGLLLSGPTKYAISQLEQIAGLCDAYPVRCHRKERALVGVGFDDAYVVCEQITLKEITEAQSS